MQVCVDINELIFIGLDNPDCDHLFEFVPKEFIDKAEKINIVRCEECKHAELICGVIYDSSNTEFYTKRRCALSRMQMPSNGFCSYGEPKESEVKQ